VAEIDPDMVPDLEALTHELEAGRRVSQPRLRLRLQVDTVGLDAVTHRLIENGDSLAFEFDDRGAPEQQILGAAQLVPNSSRRSAVFVVVSPVRGARLAIP
jgi:hypothetical protein